jgi:hypothetical protein
VILPSRIILDIQRSGRQQAITVEDVDVALAAVNPGEVIDLNLDEIFEAYVIGKPDIGTQPTAPLERVA